MLRDGAGVVGEAGKGIIHPLCCKKRQRARHSFHRDISAVGDAIIDIRKVRHGEDGLKCRYIIGGNI